MILTKIREKTLEYHDDFTSWANNIFNGTITLDGYKYVLKTFYGFYSTLEQKIGELENWDSADLNFEKRKKVQLLIKDMKALGITDQEINEITLCNDLPQLNNLPQVLGCLYVIEGATLGGQLI